MFIGRSDAGRSKCRSHRTRPRRAPREVQKGSSSDHGRYSKIHYSFRRQQFMRLSLGCRKLMDQAIAALLFFVALLGATSR